MKRAFGAGTCLFFLFASSRALAEQPGVVIARQAIQPQIALGGEGGIHVVFIHKGNISVAVSKDKGKSFGEPVIAMDAKGRASGGMQRGPRIGVDLKKNITVTAPLTFDDAEFEKKYPTSELYLVTSSDEGKTWSKPLRINEVPKKAPEALHWMAVQPSGEVHVAWLDLRGRPRGGQDIYYAKVASGKVGKNLKVASEVCECCAPGLAVDGKGNPLIAYREAGTKPSREIYALRSTNKGESFGKGTRLNRSPSNLGT